MGVAYRNIGKASLPAQAASRLWVPALRCWRWGRERAAELRADVGVLRAAINGECQPRRGIKRVKQKNGLSLGFVLATSWVRQESLVLIGHTEVVHLRNPMGIEGRTSLRTRIKQAWDLGLVRVVQIAKCSAGSHHAIRGKLCCDSYIPRIAEMVCNRRNDGKVRLLRSARNRQIRY